MSIYPKGEHLRKAVKWISEKRKDNTLAQNKKDDKKPDKKTDKKLIEEACVEFNLSPKEAQFLLDHFLDNGK